VFGAGVSPGVSWYSVLAIFWPRPGVCPLVACRMRWGISVREIIPSILVGIVVAWGTSASWGVGGIPWNRAGPRASPWSEVMIVWASSFLAIWRAAWAACRACCG